MQVLILGIGNILMGDEGVGSHVAQYLSTKKLLPGIECIDGGTGGFHLLGLMQERKKIILIDATVDGKKSGTITKLKPRFSSDYPRTLTAHDIGLKDLLDSFYLIGTIPDITLFAISIEHPAQATTELSQNIKDIIPEIAENVLLEAYNFMKEL